MTQKTNIPESDDDALRIEDLHDESDLIPLSPLADFYPDSGCPPNPSHERLIREVAAHIDNPNIAIVVLDADLCIIHVMPATKLLFSDYYVIEKKPFFNVFRQSLELEEIRQLISSLKSLDQGYSWSGTLRHKTPTAKTLYTNTIFLPFFNADHVVSGFLVHFFDITYGYNNQLRTTFKSILEAAKLKDNETGLHNERVGYYSKKMAEFLFENHMYAQIDPDFIENIGFLAAMHDVGKIGTPDYILQKPGKLTDLEWDIMREHTINGTFILSSYPVPMAKEIALSHHEWWNGAGYPFKLEGEMIPLAARITTIADVYDALRMKRTYKEECTHEETVNKIYSNRGSQFDPSLVDVFMRISQEFNDIWNLLRDTDDRQDGRDHSKEFSESL